MQNKYHRILHFILCRVCFVVLELSCRGWEKHKFTVHDTKYFHYGSFAEIPQNCMDEYVTVQAKLEKKMNWRIEKTKLEIIWIKNKLYNLIFYCF